MTNQLAHALNVTIGQAQMMCIYILYLLPLRRRRHFAITLTVGGILYLVLNFSYNCLVPLGAVFWAFETSAQFLFLCLLVWRCADISPLDAFYCGVWAMATGHFAYELSGLQDRLGFALSAPDGRLFHLNSIPAYLVVGVAAWFLFARRLPVEGRYGADRRLVITAFITTLPFDFFTNMLVAYNNFAEANYLVFFTVVLSTACCICLLYLQYSAARRGRLEYELGLFQQLFHQQRGQYELSKENIAIINHKCHDLKHQVAALRTASSDEQREKYIAEVENSVQIYDSVVKTGNEVLDTVLTEKSLYCEHHQITMSCVADGGSMAFMDAIDIYTIFGNALDNAIEYVSKLDSGDKRLIGVGVYREKNLLMIRIENYIDAAPVFWDDLPVTTKERDGYHGFGLKSIRHTAEKYGGSMTASAEGKLFVLRVLIPLTS